MGRTRGIAAALVAFVALVPCDAASEPGIRKGPWLMDPSATGITVMVERAAPGSLHVRAVPLTRALDGGALPTSDVEDRASVALHEVRLADLHPGTRYAFEVSGPGIAGARGSFDTPSTQFAPFRFVVFGDTRSNAGVHSALVHAVEAEGAEFVVHTGDLLADGRREELWQQFFDVERDLLRTTPFVPVIGNHEIMRRGSPGVENFRRYMHVDPDSPDPELDYTFAYGNVRLVVANAYDDWASPRHRAWLENELTRARADVPNGFVIVAMHWGMCSSGPHGENRAMRNAGIDQMFRAHGVDLMLSGHDHIFERGDDHGLHYIVTGGGGAPLYREVAVKPYTLAFDSDHHYLRADVEADHIVFTAIRPDGTVIDRCALRHAGWDCPATNVPAAPSPTLASASAPMAHPPRLELPAIDHSGSRHLAWRVVPALIAALATTLALRVRGRRR